MVRSGIGVASWLALVLASGCATYSGSSDALSEEAGFGRFAPTEYSIADAEIVGAPMGGDELPGLTVARRSESLLPTATPAETEETPDDGAGAPKRLKVYTARFELLVANVDDAVDRFLERVDEVGGYLETRRNALLTVRVPAPRFPELTQELRGYGLVTDESMQALDVTKQFYDLRIRIENAELSRTRLLALLERAEEVEDALRIESEVRRLTEEIDGLKGELKFLSERIAFSTIEVQFSSTAPPPRAIPRRTRSRFDWINEVGVEHVISSF